MESIINPIFETFPFLAQFGPGALIPIACFAIVGLLGQWSLYDKCGQPGIDCIIPIKNVITFLKIVGRPANHSLLVIIPPPIILAAVIYIDNTLVSYTIASVLGALWLVFMAKVWVELAQCFGHFKPLDYALVIMFNGFYVLNLGLSYSEKYKGPVYGKKKAEAGKKDQLEGQLV